MSEALFLKSSSEFTKVSADFDGDLDFKRFFKLLFQNFKMWG